MRLAVLAALSLSACATTESYDYSGATPAPPAFTPAGAGAPTRGQPGTVGPDGKRLPPSPNKRVLPPEARPGIWASDKADKGNTVVERLHEAQPTPKGLPASAWRKCWNDSQTCLLGDPRGVRAPFKEYDCLREMFASACGGWMADRGEHGHPDTVARYGRGPYDVGDVYDATRVRKAKACAEVDRSGERFNDLYKNLYAKCSPMWMREIL